MGSIEILRINKEELELICKRNNEIKRLKEENEFYLWLLKTGGSIVDL